MRTRFLFYLGCKIIELFCLFSVFRGYFYLLWYQQKPVALKRIVTSLTFQKQKVLMINIFYRQLYASFYTLDI